MAKAGTVADLHPELEAEMDVAAAAGDAAAGTAGVADKVAAAPCRQQAAGVVLPQPPFGPLGGLILVGKNMFNS